MKKKRKHKIIIDAGYCKGCGICIHFCGNEILGFAAEVNKLGYHPPMIVDGAECNGCRQCELFCPDFAIFVIEEEEGE
jgi:2-oxoglutarate ferredoxin oxidoreductase subunit delta